MNIRRKVACEIVMEIVEDKKLQYVTVQDIRTAMDHVENGIRTSVVREWLEHRELVMEGTLAKQEHGCTDFHCEVCDK